MSRRFERRLGRGEFPAGTRLPMYQDVPPVGWFIVTAVDNHVVELTSGSGNGGATGGTTTGSVSTETFFARTATDSHTLTEGQIPSHTHQQQGETNGTGGAGGIDIAGVAGASDGLTNTAASGGGAGHTHNIDCQLQRAQLIVAEKS